MQLWRVSDYPDLDGRGGELFSGRWHHAGTPIVYTAEHSALALLEVLAQLQVRRAPKPYQLLEIDVPPGLDVTQFDATLPPENEEVSRHWGDAWLAAAKSPIARVPSSLAPAAFNYLLNPRHADAARIKVARHAQYQWDARLFR